MTKTLARMTVSLFVMAFADDCHLATKPSSNDTIDLIALAILNTTYIKQRTEVQNGVISSCNIDLSSSQSHTTITMTFMDPQRERRN